MSDFKRNFDMVRTILRTMQSGMIIKIVIGPTVGSS